MNPRIRALFNARESSDRGTAYRAFEDLMAATEEPVDWAYDVWDKIVADLAHKDGHNRAFAAQMLARLAISDPEERIFHDFAALAAVMRDDKTVTARHALQSIWRVGIAGSQQATLVLEALERRFKESASEKNGSLWRTDCITSLGKLAHATGDVSIVERARNLIDSEPDEQARKKQRASWKKAAGQPI